MSEAKPLLFVWLLLMALLALTATSSLVLTGPTGLAVNLAIAFAKGGLILWYFMQLRYESGLVRIFGIGAVAWLMILGLLTLADYATRGIAF